MSNPEDLQRQTEINHIGQKCPLCKRSMRHNIIRKIKGCTNKNCENYYHKKGKG